MKRIHISSSIANFHDKLRARYKDYGDFRWFSKDPTIFFGMYHIGDYLRFLLHRGERYIFWCGSDLLNLQKNDLYISIILNAEHHYVENQTEYEKLWHLLAGKMENLRKIRIDTHPMLFDDSSKYVETYCQSNEPTVWMTCHVGREEEYGVNEFIEVCSEAGIKGFIFKGDIDTDTFDKQTEKFQATIRFNKNDGFSENIAKALLRGQYVFSPIAYYGVDSLYDLVNKLKSLKDKDKPNYASPYWREFLAKRVEI